MPDPLRLYYRQNEGPDRALADGALCPCRAWARVDLLSGLGVVRGFGLPVKASRMPLPVRSAALSEQGIIIEPQEPAIEPENHAEPEPELLPTLVVVSATRLENLTRLLPLLARHGDACPVAIFGELPGAFRVDDLWAEIQREAERQRAKWIVAILDDDVRIPAGLIHALRVALGRGHRAVVPLSNDLGEQSVALAGERHPSPLSRFPEGADIHQIGEALGLKEWGACFPCSARSPIVAFAPPFRDLAEAQRAAVVTCDTYAWRPSPQPKIEAARVLSAWGPKATAICARVARRPSKGRAVQFLAVDLGTWGGAYCTLRLAEELCALGLRAQVGRLLAPTCQEAFPLGTVQHHHETLLPQEFAARSGWREGVLVATHWSTGRLVRRIAEANRGIEPLAFWQDLEHRFVNPKTGRAGFPLDQAREYVGIERRIVNAPWVWEEGRAEFGLGGSATVIPVGVDLDLFHPSPAARQNRGVLRVLSMWRPQTNRRGAPRLKRVYADLRRRFGARVSLEIYGWNDDAPPEVDRSHGFLRQREVAELVREVDLVVEPSDYQGFGLPGLEAMASGVALASTDTKGCWAYSDRGCAFIAGRRGDEHDEGGFLAGIAGLLEDSALRGRLALAGLERAQWFGWGAIGKRWADLLQ